MTVESWANLGEKFAVAELILLFRGNWVHVLLVLLFIGLVYYYYRPVDIFYDFTGAEDSKSYKLARGGSGLRGEQLRNRLRNGSSPEKIPLYPNGWFVLLESSEIAVNQVKYVVALGENFAVFRKSNGKVHVVDAYCPHLGANMGIGGVVKNDCLQCPFHGWQFDGETGKCTSIPYAEKVPEFAKVRTWRSVEVNHFVFVWYHAEGEEPSYEPEPIKEIINEDYWLVGRLEILMEAHIEDVAENSADCSHLEVFHFKHSWIASLFNLETNGSWKPHSDATHKSEFQVEANFRFLEKYPIFSASSHSEWVGPSHSVHNITSMVGNARMIICMTPVEPFVLRLRVRIYTRPLNMFYGRSVLRNFQKTIELETMIYNHQKLRFNGSTSGSKHSTVVKEDGPLAQFTSWYSQFYSKNSLSFKFQSDDLTW